MHTDQTDRVVERFVEVQEGVVLGVAEVGCSLEACIADSEVVLRTGLVRMMFALEAEN